MITNCSGRSLSRIVFRLQQALAYEDPGMLNSHFKALCCTAAASIRKTYVSAKFLDYDKQLSVLALTRHCWKIYRTRRAGLCYLYR